MITVGVLALQGAFARHLAILKGCGIGACEVRTVDELARCDALIMPGGESTTMSKLLESFGLFSPIADRLAGGMPTFGTCAGMILLASNVADGRADQRSFEAIDIDVRRNGYGRQIDSFEADLHVPSLADDRFTAVFIRAPLVERVGEKVEVLAHHGDAPVLCRQGNVLVSSFHPELTADDRLHRLFLQTLVGSS